jgi:hypothetical protein
MLGPGSFPFVIGLLYSWTGSLMFSTILTWTHVAFTIILAVFVVTTPYGYKWSSKRLVMIHLPQLSSGKDSQRLTFIMHVIISWADNLFYKLVWRPN